MGFFDYVKSDNLSNDVNEVVLNVNNLTKSVKLYNTIFGKKFKGVFKTLGLEEYNRKMGKGKGIRTINSTGEMLRYNWDEKLAKKASYELTSMDYWSSTNLNFQKPTRTIVFGPNTNVIQIIDKVVSELRGKKINESDDVIEEVERTRDEKRAWLKANSIPSAIATSDSMIVRSVEELGLADEYNAFLGGVETNTFEKKLIEVEKKFDSNVYADPDTVFEDVEDLLSVVAAKKWRTLVVCGMGGVGKTWHITSGPRSLSKLLGPEGDKWTYHSGTKAAPFSFYKTLFSERDKIIVFDEADSILKNPDIIMMNLRQAA